MTVKVDPDVDRSVSRPSPGGREQAATSNVSGMLTRLLSRPSEPSVWVLSAEDADPTVLLDRGGLPAPAVAPTSTPTHVRHRMVLPEVLSEVVEVMPETLPLSAAWRAARPLVGWLLGLWAVLSITGPALNVTVDGSAVVAFSEQAWALTLFDVGLAALLMTLSVVGAAAARRRWLWMAAPALLGVGALSVGLVALTATLGQVVGWLLVVLALVPGAAVSTHRQLSPSSTRRRRVRHSRLAATSAVGAGWAVAAMVAFAAFSVSPFESDPAVLALGVGTLAVFGAVVGMERRWFPWAQGVVTVGMLVWLWVGAVMVPGAGLFFQSGTLWALAVSLPAAVLASSVWRLSVSWLRLAASQPLLTLVALVAFNVADAALTQASLLTGGALELNPLIDRFGMIPKLVVVPLAGWGLYKLAPRVLVWPMLALAVVSLWHLTGILVNA